MEKIQLTILKASKGMWLYDGVTEPCKSTSLPIGKDDHNYYEITEEEYQQIIAAEAQGGVKR